MATSVCKSKAILIVPFLYLALLLPAVMGEGKFDDGTCYILSGTWIGICLHPLTCNQQRKEKEGALMGRCDDGHCWCGYVHCRTTCRKPSGTWNGICTRSDHFKAQCVQQESAVGGYCDVALMCQCLYNC